MGNGFACLPDGDVDDVDEVVDLVIEEDDDDVVVVVFILADERVLGFGFGFEVCFCVVCGVWCVVCVCVWYVCVEVV
jgi:hypothetical protein